MNKPDIENRQIRRLLLLGSVMAILIAVSPYIFYFYEVFPKTKAWQTPFFTVTLSGYDSFYNFAWYLANKLMPLYLLLIWFLTCRHWWHRAIFIPIAMYAFQLVSLINVEAGYTEVPLFYQVFSLVLFLFFVYLLRVKCFNPVMKDIDLRALHIEKDKEQKVKKSSKKVTLAGGLVALFIAVSPLVFYVYRIFPDHTNTWETFLFNFKSPNYPSLYSAVWYFVNKFVPLYLFLLWLLTCRHWWKYIILIPITLYIFQLFTILNSSIKYVDEMEIYWLIPVILATAAAVYSLRLNLFYRIVHGIDLEKLNREVKGSERTKM